MTASINCIKRDGIPIIVAENARLCVEVMPQCGGKIASLHDKSRSVEWMWRNPHLQPRLPNGSTRYVQEFDNGGWDECFPTIAPGILPNGDFAGLEVHDHGELWMREWNVSRVECTEVGAQIGLSVEVPELCVSVSRLLTIPHNGASMSARYQMQSCGTRDVAYTWAVHPLIPLEEGMRVETPVGARFVTSLVTGNEPAPSLDAAGILRLPGPWMAEKSGHSFKGVFVGDFGSGITLRRSDGAGLSFAFAGRDFDGVALWCNAGGWSGCGSEPYNNIGFEPQAGLSDDLAEAMKNGGALARLSAGEVKTWELEVKLY